MIRSILVDVETTYGDRLMVDSRVNNAIQGIDPRCIISIQEKTDHVIVWYY